MLKAILGFLFGKPTNIFNKNGRVQHDLGQQKWEAWNNRLAENPKYNWRNHKGKTGAGVDNQPPAKTP